MENNRALSFTEMLGRLDRRQVFFAAAVLGGCFSRIGMVLTGYTSDDYYFALHQHASGLHSLVQGRFLAPLLSMLLVDSGFTQTSIQLPLFVLSVFVLAALIAKAIDMTLLPRRPLPLAAAAAALCASYPYLSSYYLFRMVILDQILVYLIVLWAISIMSGTRHGAGRKMLFGSIIVGLGSGDNQLVFIFFSIIALAWLVRLLVEPPLSDECRSPASRRRRLADLAVAPVTIVGGLLIYFPLIKLVQYASHIGAEGAYSVKESSGLLHFIGVDLNLIGDIMFQAEPIIPLYLKIALVAVLVALLIRTGLHSWRAALLVLAFGAAGLAIAVAPMAVTWGGHVARIFVGAGFCIALMAGLMANFVPQPRWPAAALVALSFYCALMGATMFYQQHLLAHWDQQKAAAIYMDLAREFPLTQKTRIQLIGGSAKPYDGLSTYQEDNYGVNESALRSDWDYAYAGLFRVATGRILNIKRGPPQACAGKPAWPRKGSIFSAKPDLITVCL